MTLLGRLVLPVDVAIVAVAEVDPSWRDRLTHEPGDFCVTRPRSRAMTSVVDPRTAALLERFRTPSTIVDAVIAFSAEEGLDPRRALDEAFAVLRGFVSEGLLVDAESEVARPIASTLEPGTRVGDATVLAPTQVMVDTEVHAARTGVGVTVALKIARNGAGPQVAPALAREAAVLRHLDGHANPALHREGVHDGRRYLMTAWCHGADAHEAAAEARDLEGPEGRRALLDLVEAVVAAYAHLHGQGVLHGDVHPRNVLVSASGDVVILDYGLAVAPGLPASPGWRGGLDFFMEPEVARAHRSGRRPPALTHTGEQYAVAALVYLMLTGAHTHTFALEQEEMFRQLREDPPLAFASHGCHDLRAVEVVVRRALAKEPQARYPSLDHLLAAYRAAARSDLEDSRHPRRGTSAEPAVRGHAGQLLLDGVLARLAVPGALFDGGLAAPTASVMNGGAGFAYALLRLAGLGADGELLALADLWSTRAVQQAGREEAFWNADLEIVPETFGEHSFYHHKAGVQAVQALVAHARADEAARRLAVEAFVAAAARPCSQIDVAFGRAGVLLGCALVLDVLPNGAERESVGRCGTGVAASLWSELLTEAPVREADRLTSLGAAHGWAGMLYALLRWADVAGTPAQPGLDERLDQLAALGVPQGRGVFWPHASNALPAETGLGASWCNGAAGYVPLWALAHRLLANERFGDLTVAAAWTASEGPPNAPADLCCGSAGRAYALLTAYRQTGDAVWLARARKLALHAAEGIASRALRRDSLYKGEVGVALLVAELAAPDDARMPLFEGEDWPPR